jgi:hypothetical protein
VPAVDVAYGRSRLGMQLVPAGAGACFSARDFGRPPAPAMTASIDGSKVTLHFQAGTTSPSGFMDLMRAQGDGPFTLLARFPDKFVSFADSGVHAGVMYRYQLHAVENSTDPQLPYNFVCGASAEVRITVPQIAPRRRAVH